ncbi:MAG: phosphotransferase [Terrimesophilobacter sp.]
MSTTGTMIDALAEWVGSQRWFVGGRTRAQLGIIHSMLHHSDARTRVETLVISDDGGAWPVFYQVPVVLRRQRREQPDQGFIGLVDAGEAQPWFAYDGPTDTEFTLPLLARLSEREGAGSGSGSSERMTSTVLRGEQSNTSIVYSSASGEPLAICKIFRMLHHGENPDVVLQSALALAGSTTVPAIVGSIVGEWPDSAQPSGVARGHLAFAQRFLVGAEDGWQLALDAASDGTDFTREAHSIGAAVADVHATLASALPTRAANEEDFAIAVFEWQRRLDAAIAAAPEIETVRNPIEALYSRAESVPWPQLQRIHGDLHLGQLLRAPDGLWTIIDFEGEPMRPLAERSRLDIPLRDVAGMLRSIDYAAGSRASAPRIEQWVGACRAAFLDGYGERSRDNAPQNLALLAAFEMDKALYEVVYEAHNRPAWLPIPTAAVFRLAAESESSVTSAR